MAVSAELYSNFALGLMDDLFGDMNSARVFKVMLCTSTYTPNQDTHKDKADVDNEVSGTGYSAGGAALASKTLTLTENVCKWDAADTSWSGSTLTARYAVIYDDTEAADADKQLVGWINFGEDKSSEAGTFQITWNASGILTLTVANLV